MKAMRGVILIVLATIAVFGQTSPARPEFEVASIKPSAPPTGGQVNVGLHIDGAQVRCTFLSIKDYVGMAYKVKAYQISGPDWIASERFDIAAKLPAGATREQVPAMLQALLADRFQIKMHRDTKEFPVYGLVVAKGGLKIKESADSEPDSGDAGKGAVNVTAVGGRGGTSVDLGKGSSFTIANNRLEARKLAMDGLAEMLARFVDRPVVNATELKGRYDFALEFAPDDFRAMMIRSAIAAGVTLPPEARQLVESASGDSLPIALQTLGLKLESRKAPLELLVIDQVQKAPTDN